MRFEQFRSGDAGPTKSSARHATSFPVCGRYLINWMNPAVLKAKVKPRWNLFVKFCTDERLAEEACTWGKGPMVQINSAIVGRANGKFKASTHPQHVFIHGKVANKYERGDGWVIWEATVFHEMIHWARFHAGQRDGKDYEAGQAFEEEAYGEHIELTTKWRAGA
jgi:hypothetical protein